MSPVSSPYTVVSETQPLQTVYETIISLLHPPSLLPSVSAVPMGSTFIRYHPLWFNSTAGSQYDLCLGIIDPFRKFSRRKPTKHYRMNSPNPRTRQHPIHRLWYHRHYSSITTRQCNLL